MDNIESIRYFINMITLRNILESELNSQPDLIYWLQKDLINVNSLARYLRPAIEKKYGGMIGLETISMTIRRLFKDDKLLAQRGIRAPRANNIQLQLNVSILTFEKHLPLHSLNNNQELRFFSFAQGRSESMLAISQEDEPRFSKTAVRTQRGMAALTITLSNETHETVGAYGYIVLLLALAAIPLAEIITVHDDITLLIADEYIDKAFQILRKTLNSVG